MKISLYGRAINVGDSYWKDLWKSNLLKEVPYMVAKYRVEED